MTSDDIYKIQPLPEDGGMEAQDWTTKIHNRHSFFNLAWRELERTRRYDRSLAVIMLDIDYFKQVIDKYGHKTGDKVLQTIATRCLESLRGGVDLLGRYGSEDFAILLPETDISSAQQIAERLNQIIAQSPITIDERESVSVTVSLGVAAVYPQTSIGLGELFTHADQALKSAKQGGRNRVHVWKG